jgi:hypothetical protein
MKLKPVLSILSVLIFSQLILGVQSCSSNSMQAGSPPGQENEPGVEGQIESAVLEAIAERRLQSQAEGMISLQVDDIRLSQDGYWSTAWILYYDQALELNLPTEPGMVISFWDGTAWKVTLPREAGWDRMLQSLPDDLLPEAEKEMWSAMNQGESIQAVEATPDTGYKLPWLGGVTGYMSRSVAHDDDYTTAHYSFDFFFFGDTICPTSGESGLTGTTGVTGVNFELRAAKAGTVWGFKDTVVDCDHTDVNFIVLRNNDNPANFQLYLHLSQDSIPDELKHVGAPVAQGQFLGRADNTGNSTGSHLHFQLQGQPYWPADNPYWAVAKDMVFSEVNIYGGHPRREWEVDSEYCQGPDGDFVCDEYGRINYLSANYPSGDSFPPTGGLSGITLGQVIETSTLTLSGWGDDVGTGLNYMQLTAFFNSSWHDIGYPFTDDFTYNWDLCNPNTAVPDGLVSVALKVYDQAGNVSWEEGISHFIKNYACPVPPTACIPGPEQVALFEGLDYVDGCVIFGIGNYANADSLTPLGNDDAASILVGSNVMATLYSEGNYAGHSQTLLYSDHNLSDNLVPADRMSSLRVWLRQDLPAVPLPLSPASGIQFKQNDVIMISWRNGGGAIEYQVELTTPTDVLMLPWQTKPYLPLKGLTQGFYSWRVRGRNPTNTGSWSASRGFGVGLPETWPEARVAPYIDNMDSSSALWGDIGIWSLKAGAGVGGTSAWWYQETDADYATGSTNYGWLTSPPITVPASNYYLRFYYRTQTETYTANWDQRWVQISVDGGPFENIYQLAEDVQYQEASIWLQSPPISLGAYSRKTIQARFYFHTLDEALNGYLGWGIDDFSITTNSPVTCTDLLQDSTPAQATPLAYNDSYSMYGEICPNGDWDYYQFSGLVGDRVVVDIDAMSEGSLLDPYIYLLDSDGSTLLAENDDEIYAVRRDSLLAFTLPHDGTYYIKVRAWKHPTVGGQDNYYTIRLYQDRMDPDLAINWPQNGAVLPDAVFNVVANVSDANDGVNRVEFYWHNQEWGIGTWEQIGTDWDGSDGWSASFDPAGQPEGQGAGIFAIAYDRAGNSAFQAVWNLIIDKTAPTSAMYPLNATQSSTAFQISWSGNDNSSGIAYYELQYNLNGGDWQNDGQIPGSLTAQWMIGAAGNSYQYRMHAIDYAGNSEPYPTSAEASTSIPSASTLCAALDVYDTGTNDNTAGMANSIVINGSAHSHNFCNPLATDRLFDQDWIAFPVQVGSTYFIEATTSAAQSAVRLSLLASDGSTLLAEAVPDWFGERTLLHWTADQDGMVYVRMQHVDGRVIGSVVAYQVQVWEGYGFYLPIMHK